MVDTESQAGRQTSRWDLDVYGG